MGHSLRYAAVGALLALGAPLGWLALEGGLAHPGSALELLRASSGLYLYLLLATAAAFATFGAAHGRLDDELEAKNRSLEALARTDSLTGLANVRAFRAQLELECARARRDAAPLALIMMDLDHFKRVNDAHGHATGDRVLASAARLLVGALRAGDFAARVGGEEFAVLCPYAALADAMQIAERARLAIEATPVLVAGTAVGVTASFGVARFCDSGDALCASADAALYAAKDSGRNRVMAGPRDPLAVSADPT